MNLRENKSFVRKVTPSNATILKLTSVSVNHKFLRLFKVSSWNYSALKVPIAPMVASANE